MATPKTPVSPKVIFGGFVAGLVTLLLTSLSAITPTTFDFLGKWSPLVYGVVILASYAITAWWTADPLRLKPEDQLPAKDPEPQPSAVAVNAPATASIATADPLSSVLAQGPAEPGTFPAAAVNAAAQPAS